MPATRKRKAPSQDPPEAVEKPPKISKTPTSKKKPTQQQSKSSPVIASGPNDDQHTTGTESDSQQYKTLTIPGENDKVISCQLHGPDPKSSSDVKHLLIFTHGAGGGIEDPGTKLFAEGCAATGMSILSFQGAMNLKNRVKSFERVLEHCKEKYPNCEFFVGGRSMGARAAVMVAGEHEEVERVIAASYPLCNPKGDVRDEILLELDEGKSVCFLSGDKDDMCSFELLEKVRGKMVAKTKLVAVTNADHGWSLFGAGKDRAKATEEIRRFGGQVAAQWLRGERDGDGQIQLQWDKDGGKVVVENGATQGNGNDERNEGRVHEKEQSDTKEKPEIKKGGNKPGTGRKAQNVEKNAESKAVPDREGEHKGNDEGATTTPRRSKRNKG